jgi:hypothetical protein
MEPALDCAYHQSDGFSISPLSSTLIAHCLGGIGRASSNYLASIEGQCPAKEIFCDQFDAVSC